MADELREQRALHERWERAGRGEGAPGEWDRLCEQMALKVLPLLDALDRAEALRQRMEALADDLVQASESALERAEKARPWGDEHRSDASTYRHCAKRIRETLTEVLELEQAGGEGQQ